MSEYLFVYGTLRGGVGHPMHKLLSAGADAAGSATYAGRLFDLGRYPGAVPGPHSAGADYGWRVIGEVYRLRDPATVLEALDEYEGCAPSSPQPHEYQRVLQPVRLAGNPEDKGGSPEHRAVQAWVYLYIAPLSGARQIESGDYLLGGKFSAASGGGTG